MFRCGWLALALAAFSLASAAAQPQPPAPAQAPSAPQQAPPPDNWASGCTTSARGSPLDCSIVQRAIESRTGQLVAMVRIRIPPDAKNPVMLVQMPLGVYLPGKLSMNIDGADAGSIDFQTCDQAGCYAGTPISDAFLSTMMKGQTLNLTVQDQQHKPQTVPITLIGFGKAYGNIQ